MTVETLERPSVALLDPDIILEGDLRQAARRMGPDEARFLVDGYYLWQDQRKRANNQVRALGESAEPTSIIRWLAAHAEGLERKLRAALDAYSSEYIVGRWAKSIVGIGPVISAGLMAHIDIEKAPTVGHIWRFAGLDPTTEWGSGQKRPWNAALKTLCWKVGESFVKVQNRDGDVYGHVYAERKVLEAMRNEAGEYADQAQRALERKRYGKDTEAYKHYSAGRLPPAHIHARAKRYAAKLFLAHWHHVAHEAHHGRPPPKPYIIENGHTHYIAPPNWPMGAGSPQSKVRGR